MNKSTSIRSIIFTLRFCLFYSITLLLWLKYHLYYDSILWFFSIKLGYPASITLSGSRQLSCPVGLMISNFKFNIFLVSCRERFLLLLNPFFCNFVRRKIKKKIGSPQGVPPNFFLDLSSSLRFIFYGVKEECCYLLAT